MDAYVAGSTGLIGQALIANLLEEGRVRRITSLVRRPSGLQHPKLDERVVDFDRLESELAQATTKSHAVPEAPEPMHVFCCLGTTMAKAGSEAAFRRVDYDFPLALARYAVERRAELFSIVTAVGANPQSSVFYNRVKGELEAELRKLELRKLRIFQPSLLLGDRAERRAGEALGAILAKPLGAFMVGPLRKFRPVQGDAVARAMLRVALEPGAERVRVYASDEIAEIGS